MLVAGQSDRINDEVGLRKVIGLAIIGVLLREADLQLVVLARAIRKI